MDEVKKIRDVSIAMRAYAKQAENLEMEADAIEIRMRAGRRMDHMRQEQKATVGLASGREGKRKALGLIKNPSDRPMLAEAGISKNLANEGRKLGALSEKEFERAVGSHDVAFAGLRRPRSGGPARRRVSGPAVAAVVA